MTIAKPLIPIIYEGLSLLSREMEMEITSRLETHYKQITLPHIGRRVGAFGTPQWLARRMGENPALRRRGRWAGARAWNSAATRRANRRLALGLRLGKR